METASKKKGKVLEFLSSLPGLLTAIATIVTALGGLYVALRPSAKPEAEKSTSAVNVPLNDITLKKGEPWITDHVGIELVDVETLKGKSGRNEPSSHDFNKRLNGSERIFSVILNEAGVTDYDAKKVLAMNQAEWELFLDSLDKNKREIIKETPFARFNVSIDGKRDDKSRGIWFFKGESLVVKDQGLSFVIVSIANTKSFIATESVTLRRTK